MFEERHFQNPYSIFLNINSPFLLLLPIGNYKDVFFRLLDFGSGLNKSVEMNSRVVVPVIRWRSKNNTGLIRTSVTAFSVAMEEIGKGLFRLPAWSVEFSSQVSV